VWSERDAPRGLALEETDMSETPDARDLILQLGDPQRRDGVTAALEGMGAEALPALRDGLRDGDWRVRRWCAYWLDRHPDAASLPLLLPLLRDAKSLVRLFAVHSLSCEHCKESTNPLDVVPHLVERIADDESIRVRRMAAAMLAYGRPDVRAIPVFRALLEHERDGKLRRHATLGLMRCREAGLVRTP
jgi:HEAT repeat protein